MEYLKITKVDNITLHRRGRSFKGSLHLTTHHLIFTLAESSNGHTNGRTASLRELWCCYPIIERVELRKGSALMYKRSWKGVNEGVQVGDRADGTSGQGREEEEEREKSKQSHNLELEEEVEAWKRDQLYKGANLKIYCRDYNYMSFDFQDVTVCKDVYDSVMKLTCTGSIEECYAFLYEPIVIEAQYDSWWDYDPQAEFVREGLSFDEVENVKKRPGELESATLGPEKSGNGRHSWRMTGVNEMYDVCDTYPRFVCVPADVQDAVITESSKFRSRARFPCLAYYYRKNGCTIMRCSQPLVGIKQNRSYQDERLVYGAFSSNGHGKEQNLVVDARPVTSAMAQMAVGARTESMDNYWGETSRKLYLGLENIHVIRDSMNSVKEVLRNGDVEGAVGAASTPEIAEHRAEMHEQLAKSGWRHYVSQLLKATDLLVKWIHLKGAHMVVHCSDGWDRTPQVISLVEICIDPYFRTLDGFFVLVEKDWCSFGHRFNDRCGRLNTEGKFHDYASSKVASVGTRFRNFQGFKSFRQLNQALRSRPNAESLESPTFQQFLDCVYQLMRQNPTAFQYNERFLRRLVYHLYSCQYGTFLQNCDKERYEHDLPGRTRSVWDYFKARRAQFTNPDYCAPAEYSEDTDYDYDANVLYPNYTDVIFWYQLNGRSYEDMNGVERRMRKAGSSRSAESGENGVEEDGQKEKDEEGDRGKERDRDEGREDEQKMENESEEVGKRNQEYEETEGDQEGEIKTDQRDKTDLAGQRSQLSDTINDQSDNVHDNNGKMDGQWNRMTKYDHSEKRFNRKMERLEIE